MTPKIKDTDIQAEAEIQADIYCPDRTLPEWQNFVDCFILGVSFAEMYIASFKEQEKALRRQGHIELPEDIGNPERFPVTESMLNLGMSRNGSWSYKQIRVLGGNMQVSGWMQRLLKSTVTDAQVKEFLRLKNKHLKNKF